MTRSIFDPTGPNTEHSGSRNLGPDANQISQMPPKVTDGKVSEDEIRDAKGTDVVIPDQDAETDAIAAAADEVAATNPDQPEHSVISKAQDLSNPGTEPRR